MADMWDYARDAYAKIRQRDRERSRATRFDATAQEYKANVLMRLLKISEEYGEATQAYLGMEGQNPRKGFTGETKTDVANELCDVLMATMVALHDYTTDPAEFFEGFLAGKVSITDDE